ncbi:RT0821/Lpp0805 family surface protein, partial [Rhizobiaceae sp. 2RAB30]
QTSDQVTIRNAVSSADLDALGATGLAWANTDTGSRGAITQLTQYDRKGLLCRKFKASRESFDGVRLYAGDACRAGDGSWRMLEFVES